MYKFWQRKCLKCLRGLYPEILIETFVSKVISYNLRKSGTFEGRQVQFVYHVTKSL